MSLFDELEFEEDFDSENDSDLTDVSEVYRYESDDDWSDDDVLPLSSLLRNNKRKWESHSDDEDELHHVACEGNVSNILKPASAIHVPCCVMLCLTVFTIAEISFARSEFQSLTKFERSQWILDWLRAHSSFSDDGKVCFQFIVGTTKVCLLAWLAVLGVPKSTFYAIRKNFLAGQKVLSKAGQRKGFLSGKSLSALSWLKHFGDNYSEKIPNKTQLHLPPCLTKRQVYAIFKQEMEDQTQDVVSESHFMKIWRSYLPHLAIPKKSRFSKCDKCTLIKTELSTTKDKNKRQILFKKRERHLMQQNTERQKYYKHAKKARSNPRKYLSIIIDAIDQAKTNLPHFLYVSKYLANMWKLRVNLVGVIIHGVGIYGFFDYFQWSHGSNLTISILVQCLLMVENLPKTLYLQMDNCPGQNKNRFVFGFLCMLVELDVFKKIKVSFLMVGHTHEDVDQVFSRYSHFLGKHAVLTLDKMLNAFEKCYSPTPIAVKTTTVYSFMETLKLNNISGHSRPHVFKITKNELGKAKIWWKKWSSDKKWNETDDPLLMELPTDVDAIKPSYSKIDLKRIQSDISKARNYFKKEEDFKWWNEFISSLESEDDELEELNIASLAEKLNSTSSYEDQNTEPEPEDCDMEVSDEDDPIQPVIIGKKRK